MTPGRKAFVTAVILGAAAFVAACFLARAWVLLPLPLIAAGAWLLCLRLSWRRLSGACFTVLVCGAAAGLFVGLSAVLLLVVSLAAVAAWDLEALARASRGAADMAAARRAGRAHIARLLVILGTGALGGAAALFLRLPLGFGAILGLAALLAVSLSVLIRSLAR